MKLCHINCSGPVFLEIHRISETIRRNLTLPTFTVNVHCVTANWTLQVNGQGQRWRSHDCIILDPLRSSSLSG